MVFNKLELDIRSELIPSLCVAGPIRTTNTGHYSVITEISERVEGSLAGPPTEFLNGD